MKHVKKDKLSNIEPDEVSIVGKPANKRPFIFFKGDAKKLVTSDKQDGEKLVIAIESDGSVEGTKILVNGEEIADMDSFNFSFYVPQDGAPENVSSCISCAYSKVVDTEDGFKRSETYYLSKGEHTMDKELIGMLKKLSGDKNYTFKKQELSEDAVKALKEAVATVEKYKEEMPDDLLKAVAVLAEFAASGYGETKEEDKKDDKDATKTDPEKKDNQDADKKKDDDVNKASDEIVKSITALKEEITKYGSSITKVTEDVTALATRMEVVEKTTGIKKGIESQGDDKDGNDLFPGLKI